MRKAHQPSAGKGSTHSYHTSLNDMLIGLIFIFVILLVASALSYKSAEARAERLQIELDERADIRLRLLNSLRDDLAANGIQNVVVDGRNGILRLPEHALFESGQSFIPERKRPALRYLAAALARRVPCYAAEAGRTGCPADSAPILEAIYVEGHTDNVAIRSLPFGNWDLSSDRAITTYRTLLQSARSLAQIRNVQNTSALIGVSAYADERPVHDNLTEEHRRENRRIDLRFLLSPRGAR